MNRINAGWSLSFDSLDDFFASFPQEEDPFSCLPPPVPGIDPPAEPAPPPFPAAPPEEDSLVVPVLSGNMGVQALETAPFHPPAPEITAPAKPASLSLAAKPPEEEDTLVVPGLGGYVEVQASEAVPSAEKTPLEKALTDIFALMASPAGTQASVARKAEEIRPLFRDSTVLAEIEAASREAIELHMDQLPRLWSSFHDHGPLPHALFLIGSASLAAQRPDLRHHLELQLRTKNRFTNKTKLSWNYLAYQGLSDRLRRFFSEDLTNAFIQRLQELERTLQLDSTAPARKRRKIELFVPQSRSVYVSPVFFPAVDKANAASERHPPEEVPLSVSQKLVPQLAAPLEEPPLPAISAAAVPPPVSERPSLSTPPGDLQRIVRATWNEIVVGRNINRITKVVNDWKKTVMVKMEDSSAIGIMETESRNAIRDALAAGKCERLCTILGDVSLQTFPRILFLLGIGSLSQIDPILRPQLQRILKAKALKGERQSLSLERLTYSRLPSSLRELGLFSERVVYQIITRLTELQIP
jgi:hypothetical protein